MSGTAVIIAVVIGTNAALAVDRHVPSQFASVSAAVANSIDGDRIVIAAGLHDCTGVEVAEKALHFVGDDTEPTILENVGESSHLYLYKANGTTIRHLTFIGGQGHESGFFEFGGAIHSYKSQLSVSDCTFRDNESDYGGAILSEYAMLDVQRCVFESNRSTGLNYYGGGAIGSRGGGLSVIDCWFADNDAANGEGGAIGTTGDLDVTVINSVFIENAAYRGGALRNWKSDVNLLNCTFVNNVSQNGTTIGSIHPQADTFLDNCVLTSDAPGALISDEIDAVTVVGHSLLAQAWSGDGDNNIIAAATFVSDVEPLNLCLAAGTPGVNAGDDDAVPAGVVHDYDGRDRVIGSAVDMGAFETPLEIEPPATGACCVGTSCIVMTEAQCLGSAGTYLGDDLTCAGAPCAPPAPTGACCLGVTCEVLTQDDCAALAGEYLGDDVPCGGDACAAPDPVGACCHPDGTCTTMTAAECNAAGGTYEGDDALCAEVACVQPPTTGACCLASGTCSVMTETSCANQGGTFIGVGASCADAECDANEPVSGACCFSTGGCLTLDGATCDLVGGTFLGAGVTCSGSVCSEPDPCPEDLDGSGDVGFNDLTSVLADWGSCPGCFTDLDGDELVGFNDVVLILSAWGPCAP